MQAAATGKQTDRWTNRQQVYGVYTQTTFSCRFSFSRGPDKSFIDGYSYLYFPPFFTTQKRFSSFYKRKTENMHYHNNSYTAILSLTQIKSSRQNITKCLWHGGYAGSMHYGVPPPRTSLKERERERELDVRRRVCMYKGVVRDQAGLLC